MAATAAIKRAVTINTSLNLSLVLFISHPLKKVVLGIFYTRFGLRAKCNSLRTDEAIASPLGLDTAAMVE
jgi:hypothetical protein